MFVCLNHQIVLKQVATFTPLNMKYLHIFLSLVKKREMERVGW